MEKQRNKVLAFLPNDAATAVTFQVSPPISAAGKGPVVSLVPKEARRKSRNGSFDTREPASPKVSCIGQIKSRKKKSDYKHGAASPPQAAFSMEEVKRKKKTLLILKMFKGTKQYEYDVVSNGVVEVAERVPSLGQMKQFCSARGRLSDFDWRATEATASCVINPLYEEKIVGETRRNSWWKTITHHL